MKYIPYNLEAPCHAVAVGIFPGLPVTCSEISSHKEDFLILLIIIYIIPDFS
jgi:hypothetical protein